jgi:alpha-L-fucosidase
MEYRKFTADNDSLSQHQVPDWYHDAKFGIFIHWSVSSIPCFAPADVDINSLVKNQGQQALFSNSPYSEWYLNSLRIKGSPVFNHHHATYGSDYSYQNFGELFNQQLENWNPSSWAEKFKSVNAKYVVLVTKHHDGFLLWPSMTRHPHRSNWFANRDVVKELTGEVRNNGMKMGYYYSGALDWSFTDQPITSLSNMITNGPTSQSYANYVHKHYRELIDTYAPDVLWNDIAYPAKGRLKQLIAHYYNSVPEGIINDRWVQFPAYLHWLTKIPVLKNRINDEISKSFASGTLPQPQNIHTDYSTPEYKTLDEISPRKWECVRGIGHSFGHNAQEPDTNFLSAQALIHMLIDIVSKNGNLLLNVGPMADGTIPEQQLTPLTGLGKWLDTYGEAIFSTRPWTDAQQATTSGIPVWFTRKASELYIFLPELPDEGSVGVPNLIPAESCKTCWLATGESLDWIVNNGICEIQLPSRREESPAHVIKLDQITDRKK